MANASRLFRTLRLPAAKAAPWRLGVLPLEDRAVPSVSVPLSGFSWTPFGPAPIAASTSADNPGGTTAPGDLSTGGRVAQVATATEVIPAGEPGAGGTRNVFLAATPGGGVARGVERAPGDVTWSFTTDRITDGVTAETQRSLKFGAVSVAPQNPNIVYAGGGDLGYGSALFQPADRVSLDSYAGRGLYKSVDGGKSWRRIEGPQVPVPATTGVTVGAFDRAAVSKIVFDPRPGQENTVFVVVNASRGFTGGVPFGLNRQSPVSGKAYPVTPAYLPGITSYGNAGYVVQGSEEPVEGVLRENAVYRSKDGGQTWVNVTAQLKQAAPLVDPGLGISRDTIPFAPITDLSLDSQNPNVAYVAVADPNLYLPGRAFPFNGVYRAANALADPDPVTGAVNVQYTVAFGGSGTQVPGSTLGSIRVTAAPSQPSTVYVVVSDINSPAGGPLLSAYRSTDSGINFTRVTQAPAFVDNFGAYNQAVVIDPVNANRVFLAGRSLTNNQPFIYATEDGGATFAPLNTPADAAGPYRLVRNMSLDRQGRLVLATDGGVFRQTGTALSSGWESLNGRPGHTLVDPDGAGPLPAVWTGGLAAVETLSVALPPTNADQFVTGTNANGTVRFNDPGVPGGPVAPNSPLLAPPATDETRIGGAAVYDFINPSVVYHAGTQLATNGTGIGVPDPNRLVVRSKDGGRTWQDFGGGITNPNAVTENGAPPLVIDPSDNSRLFLGTNVLNVYEGGQWGRNLRGTAVPDLPHVSDATAQPETPTSITSVGVGRFDNRIVYAAVQQRWFTPPGGTTKIPWGPALYRINVNFNVSPEPRWRDVSPSPDDRGSFNPALPGYLMPIGGNPAPDPDLPQDNSLTGVITDIDVDPFDSNVVTVTVDTPAQVGRIWRSTNGGATWADITGNLPGTRPAGRPDEALIPYTVALDPGRLLGPGDDSLYVGTSVGVYRLTDPRPLIPNPADPNNPLPNPYQWVKVGGDSMPDVQVRDLSVNTTTGLLAAATYGRGVWQFQIRPLITGFVFTDTNGNGVQDAGEAPGPGVSVRAFNLATSAEQANTLTRDGKSNDSAATGFYEFRSLPGSPDLPGRYRIELTNQSGQFLTTPERRYDASTLPATGGVVQTTTVQAGAEARGGLPGADLGVFDNATVGGVLFDDLNGNGARDAGEPGKAGVTVQLVNTDTGAVAVDPRTGQPIPAAVTDATGAYAFAGLVPLQDRSVAFNPATGYRVIPYGVRALFPATAFQTTRGLAATPTALPVTILNGQTTTQDVGLFTKVTVQGVVFDDTNGDGVRQAEPRLAGVTVRLIAPGPDGAVGTGDDVELGSRVSNPNGEYSFPNLGPGTYFVRQDNATLPPGYRPTGGGVSADGQSRTVGPVVPLSGQGQPNPSPGVPADLGPFDFGNFRDAGVAGTVFEDDNGDGQRQPTETRPVAGAVVQLLSPGADGAIGTGDDVVLATTTAGPDGGYGFGGLQPLAAGNAVPYFTRVVQPAGLFVQTSADAPVRLTSGLVTGGQNLGYFRRTTIGGFAFEDRNGNGVQDAGEPAAASFPVSLLNAEDPTQVVATGTTDATGQYRFASGTGGFSGGPLQAGGPGGRVIPYRVAVNLPGVVQTSAPGDLVLTSGVPAAGPTLALFRTVGFAGAVYDDTNGNGRRDPGEPGVGGRTVELVTPTGAVAVNPVDGQPIRAVTAADGSYTLQAPNGTFTVRPVLPAGTVLTAPAPAPVTTTSGAVLPAIDLGTFRTFAVAGVVYNDVNGNGRQDGGEPGLPGVAVRLATPAGGATQYATTTGANGAYTIPDVGPGTFLLAPALAGGQFFSGPAGPVFFAAVSGMVLPAPAVPTTFGLFRGATVTGSVFEDLNGNGVPNADEPGSPGWTVQVVNAAGVVLATGTADAAGNYTIANVPAGATAVQLANRPGWQRTLSPVPLGAALTSGGTVTPGRLGGVRLGSVAGRVFNDANRNGRQDNSELGVPGVAVELVQNGNLVASQTSGPDGGYQFLGLATGEYTVRVGQAGLAAGRVQTGPTATGLVYQVAVTVGSGTAGNAATGRDFGVAGRKRYAVAADGGGGPRVQVYDAVTGVKVSDRFVYEETFTGGVRVASADVNGDGVDDLVTVAGKGGGPRVRALDGVTGDTLYDYFAYEPTFRDGLYVAAADVNGDGFADIITGTDSGGGPRVTVFSGKDGVTLLDFFAFDDAFRGGVRIGAGDIDGDGKAEVITAAGAGLNAEVRVFDSTGKRVNTLSPVDPDYRGGLFVAGGAIDPDTGRASVLVGTGAGFADRGFAYVLDGLSGQTVFELEAFPQGPEPDDRLYTGDVRVASFDTTGDNVPEIVIASGRGVRTMVRFLDGNNRREVATLMPFEAAFLGGLFVG